MLGAVAVLFGAASAASAQYLLIPESSNDTVGMYDPYDGTYLGDLIDGADLFTTPINALLGPDGYIYVTDQVADSVFRFDTDGNYVDTFVSGYNNIRGADFYGDHLFVTSGDDYVAEFDAAGNFVGNFIQDGSDPFDIYFLDDGRSLLANIQGTDDDVRLYEADGMSHSSLFSIAFPEQIQYMPSTGHYLNISFSDSVVSEFDLDGAIYNQWAFPGGRGVYELGNGDLLLTSGNGVFSLDPSSGALEEIRGGISARFIELVPAPGVLPLLALAGLIRRRRRG
jgi:DNA-binding beta-propeller fold protein YncE